MSEIIENIKHDNTYAERDAYAIAWSDLTVEDAIERQDTNDPLEVSGDHMVGAVAWMKVLTKK